MTMAKTNIQQAVESMIESTRNFVSNALKPVNDRIDGLVEKVDLIPIVGPRGDVGAQGVDGPKGEQGEHGEKGEKGDTGEQGDTGESVTGEKGDRGEAGEPGEAGNDGADGTGEPGERGEQGATGQKGDAGERGESGADGIGKDGAKGDRGDDGADGTQGRDAAELDILPSVDGARSYRRGTWASHNGGLIKALRDTIPLDNDDIDTLEFGLLGAGWSVIVEGLAAIVVSQGDNEREFQVACMMTSGIKIATDFSIPVMLYQGIWKAGTYSKGDVVTWSGSSWHSEQSDNTDKPGTSENWKLMVKRGADGKNKQNSGEGPINPSRPVRFK